MSRDYSKKSGKEFIRIASEYDKGRKGENVEFWGSETTRLANLGEEDLVLDLGCGTGLYTVGVGRESDALMLGVDPAVGMLGQAREKSRDVHWRARTEYFTKAGFRDVEFHEYNEERYQSVEEFIEIATKKLWSMFRPITEEGLAKGVAELKQYYEDSNGAPVRARHDLPVVPEQRPGHRHT